MPRAVVVGGGVVGSTAALELAEAGWQVTVCDPDLGPGGCSHGNAGMVVPSHIVPLAAPGVVGQGLKWMLDPRSPFRLKPRLDPGLWRWTARFLRSATRGHVERSAPALREIGLLSRRLWAERAAGLPFAFGFEERGLLMLARTAHGLAEEEEGARLAERHGLEARVLDRAGVQALEPEVEVRAAGGVFYPGDAHLDPGGFLRGLWGHLEGLGVVSLPWRIDGFERRGGRAVGVRAGAESLPADAVVVAGGAWSPALGRLLGFELLLEGGKGYSFTLRREALPVRVPALLVERRVAVTPLGGRVRLAGTLELAGTDRTIDPRRVAGIAAAPPEFYGVPEIAPPATDDVWVGLRPCTPDGLPSIGLAPGWENVVVATGHGPMGLSLAPATAKLVTGLITGTPLPIDPAPFRPDR